MTRSRSSRRSAESPADRRKQILRAAVETFAERGFQRTRVSDIAKRAGVAYGLIYHYFENKDHVLDSLFAENWGIFVKVLGDIEQDMETPADERLYRVASLLIDALRIEPALIQVIIQEISRSDRFVQSTKFDAFQEAFALVQRIIEQGQERGELRSSFDSKVASLVFFGALETLCTGFTLKVISCDNDEEAESLKRSVRETLLKGMIAQHD